MSIGNGAEYGVLFRSLPAADDRHKPGNDFPSIIIIIIIIIVVVVVVVITSVTEIMFALFVCLFGC